MKNLSSATNLWPCLLMVASGMWSFLIARSALSIRVKLASANLFDRLLNSSCGEVLAVAVNGVYFRSQLNTCFGIYFKIRRVFGTERGDSFSCRVKVPDPLLFFRPNSLPIRA